MRILSNANLEQENKELKALIRKANAALQLVFKWAKFTGEHWDADRVSKVGKCLVALSRSDIRYAPDTDAIHAIAKEVSEYVEKMEDSDA